MEFSDIRSGCWASDDDTDSIRKSDGKEGEGSEMSVFVETHGDKSSDETTVENVNSGKSGFKQQFVEESTLRSIALDELEELSDPDGVAGVDGDILGRTSSTVSSEQVPIRYVILLEWDANYLRKPEGLLRLALLTCTVLSLGCVTTAGTSETDVLDLPLSSYVRAHIFVTVFSLLINLVLLFVYVSSIIQSFPIHWNVTDAAINASLSTLFIFSSSMLIHAEQEYQHIDPFISEWTKMQLSVAAVFGYLSTVFCVFLTIIRSCARTPSPISEEIILTSMRNS